MFTCHASSKHKTFRAFVLPVLDFASPVWNPHTQKNIEKIQNRGTRWICGSRFNPHTNTWSKSSSDCCHELRWPSLSNRRKYLYVTTIYDMLTIAKERKETYIVKDEKKLHGAIDESSSEQQFHKLDAITFVV